jgi:FkbM family methyltransferase
MLPSRWLKAIGRAQWRSPLLKKIFELAADRLRGGDTRIQKGVGRGLIFNPGKSNAGYVLGTSEPHVQRALELLLAPAMTVYDVGANVGFFSVIAARLVGASGQVVCYEPLEINASLIEHNAALNNFANISVRRAALGRENGTARFLTSAVPSWGRLASAGATGQHIGEIIVPIECLDSVVSSDCASKLDFLKIDVEGAEADVLAGAKTVLINAKPLLLIELHGTNDPVADALEALGYRSLVLGSDAGIRDAAWNAHIVGFTPEHAEVGEIAQELKSLEITA